MKTRKRKLLAFVLILTVMMTCVFPMQVFAKSVSGQVVGGITATGTLSHTSNSATGSLSIYGLTSGESIGLTVKTAYFYRTGIEGFPLYSKNQQSTAGQYLSVTAKPTGLSTTYIGGLADFKAVKNANTWNDILSDGTTWPFEW